MRLMLLDANPIIAAGGQIAAIILCIFFLVTIILMLAVNLGMAFLLSWTREKVNVIKLLRPTVDSVNKSSEAALQGKEVEAIEESKVAHTAAALPGSVHNINQQVNQVSSQVANAAIEFRARTAQAQAIVMTFLAPNAYRQKAMQPESDGRVPVADVERSKMVEEVKKAEEQVTPARAAAASAEEQTASAEERVSWAESPRPAIPTRRRRHVAAH